MIKVTRGEECCRKAYPKLTKNRHSGAIYYMISKSAGVLISGVSSDGLKEGAYHHNWNCDGDEDYNEPVTLCNE